MPGLLRATNEWFRIYKIPDGKPENNFAFSGEAKNKKYTFDVIHETNEAWKRLISGKTAAKSDDYNIQLFNTTCDDSVAKVGPEDETYKAIPKANPKAPAAIDPSIDKWFFLSGQPNL